MKPLKNILLVLCATSFIYCTDNKKEEQERQEELKAIKEIDSTVEAINKEIDQDIKELEEALEELDSI